MDTYDDQMNNGEESRQKPSPFADAPYVSPFTVESPMEEAAPPETPKTRKKVWPRVAAGAMALVLAAGLCGGTAAVMNGRWENRMDNAVKSFDQQIAALEKELEAVRRSTIFLPGNAVNTGNGGMSPTQVYEMCKRSVVAVTSEVSYGLNVGKSSGSGFILSENGYIVSNYHVVEGAGRLTVTAYDGTVYEASLIGGDDGNDIALLKIEAEGLPAVTLGSSDALNIGDQVVAIGNPLGVLASTQTVGYISGKDRSVSTDGTVINMLQTDAAINPGNSGGPLFNMYGQVVGITTAKYSGTTSSGASIEGIGFAIPIDDVVNKLDDLKNYGYVTGAYLGVTVRETNPAMGAYVSSVVKDGAADRGGMQPGDMIVDIGGYSVDGIATMTRALGKFKAGDTVKITVIRRLEALTLEITLDERPHVTKTAVTP